MSIFPAAPQSAFSFEQHSKPDGLNVEQQLAIACLSSRRDVKAGLSMVDTVATVATSPYLSVTRRVSNSSLAHTWTRSLSPSVTFTPPRLTFTSFTNKVVPESWDARGGVPAASQSHTSQSASVDEQ